MKTESHWRIIRHAKTIKTRYCCGYVKMLDYLNRKDKNTLDNMSWLMLEYL
jgi:hypothetical protein